jgi:diguanylate cyclase (GGDEF)-like protein
MSTPLTLAIFAAALFTSTAVTTVSTRSVDDSLRDGHSFPAVLAAAEDRLDLWYAQRRSDLATFAGSAALAEHGDRVGRPGEIDAHDAIQVYLDGLRTDYPFFASLFLLDAGGRVLVSSGADGFPPDGTRRALAGASASGPQISWHPELGNHLVSAPLTRRGHGLTLHAVIDPGALRSALSPIALEADTAVHILDADARSIAHVGAPSGFLPGSLPLPPADESGRAPSALSRHPIDDATTLVVGQKEYAPFGFRIAIERRVPMPDASSAAHRMLGLKLATAVFFTLLAVVFSGVILDPILAFQEATRSLTARDTGDPVPVTGSSAPAREAGLFASAFHEAREHLRRYQGELAQKRREIAAANERLHLQNEQLRHANQILERLSVTDELTGLHNQRYFREHLPREMMRARRTREPLTLILFDVDDFKQLNDRFGHAAGDAALQHVARVMRDQTRDMDLLARYGGEEFALVACGTNLEGAVSLAEKVRVAVSGTKLSLGTGDPPETVRVTLSAGVAAFTGDESTLFDEADRALYRAKAAGKDCVVTA